MFVQLTWSDLRDWIDATLKAGSMTVGELAERADLAPSTLLRGLHSAVSRGPNAFPISWTTVQKLVAVSAVPLPPEIAAVLENLKAARVKGEQPTITAEDVSRLLNSPEYSFIPSTETLKRICEVPPEFHAARARRADEERQEEIARRPPGSLPPEFDWIKRWPWTRRNV